MIRFIKLVVLSTMLLSAAILFVEVFATVAAYYYFVRELVNLGLFADVIFCELLRLLPITLICGVVIATYCMYTSKLQRKENCT